MNNDAAYQRLRGTENLKARKLYRSLVEHHKYASCLVCASYPKYGSMIIRGSLFEHIEDIAGFKIGISDITKLLRKNLISVERVRPRQYSIIFVELVKELERAEKTA